MNKNPATQQRLMLELAEICQPMVARDVISYPTLTTVGLPGGKTVISTQAYVRLKGDIHANQKNQALNMIYRYIFQSTIGCYGSC